MTTPQRAPSHVEYTLRIPIDGVVIEGLSLDAARHVARANGAPYAEILSAPIPLSWWGPRYGTSVPVRWRECYADGVCLQVQLQVIDGRGKPSGLPVARVQPGNGHGVDPADADCQPDQHQHHAGNPSHNSHDTAVPS